MPALRSFMNTGIGSTSATPSNHNSTTHHPVHDFLSNLFGELFAKGYTARKDPILSLPPVP